MCNSDKIQLMERCANAMADYKEQFGVQVPVWVVFLPMEELVKIVENAISDNKILNER